MKMLYEVSDEILQDCINIALGIFYPLKGFMNSVNYKNVVNNMQLEDGSIWTIPISLDVDYDTFTKSKGLETLTLTFKGKEVAELKIEDLFEAELEDDIFKVYKTNDDKHPGVKKERSRSKYRVGGPISILDRSLLDSNINPSNLKALFKKKGWKSIAGFQTRNPIHKAHEHLQRVALEYCDALFINPLTGWKKKGDFSEDSVIKGYEAMLEHYFINLNIHFDVLKTPMRYAGPKEAIFHAIIRRNLGCTHFIIGRDHAGVGNYYGTYEAHELAREIMSKHDIGIELMLLKEPYFCHKCNQIVSEKTCGHSEQYAESISGTKIREMLADDRQPNEILMRKEVADEIIKLGKNKFL